MSRNYNGGGPSQRIAKMSLASYVVDRPSRRVDAKDSTSNMPTSSTNRTNGNHSTTNTAQSTTNTTTTYSRDTVRNNLAAYRRTHHTSDEKLRKLAELNASARAAPFHSRPNAVGDLLRKSHDIRKNELLFNYVTYYRPPDRVDEKPYVTNLWSYDEARLGISYQFDGAYGWRRCDAKQLVELVTYVEHQLAANQRIREANEHQRLVAIQASNQQCQQQLRRQQQQLQLLPPPLPPPSVQSAQQPLFDPLPLAQQILRVGANPFPGLPPMLPDAAEVDNFLAIMQLHGHGHFPPPNQMMGSQRGRPNFNNHHMPTNSQHCNSSRVTYDSDSDGFYYDSDSAEVWFRRRSNKNSPGTNDNSLPLSRPRGRLWNVIRNLVIARHSSSQFLNDFSALELCDDQRVSEIKDNDADSALSQSAPQSTLVTCRHGAPIAVAICCVSPPPLQQSSLLPNGTSRVVGHHRRGGSSDLSAYNSTSTTTINSSLSDSPPPPFVAHPRPQELLQLGSNKDNEQQDLGEIFSFAELCALTPPAATSATMLDFYAEQQCRGALRSETSAEDAFEYDPSASDTENMLVDFVLKANEDDDNLGVNPESSLAELMTTPTNSIPAISRNILRPIQRPNIIDGFSSEEKSVSQAAQPVQTIVPPVNWWSPNPFARSIWAVDESPATYQSSAQRTSENKAQAENFYSYFGPDPFYRNVFTPLPFM